MWSAAKRRGLETYAQLDVLQFHREKSELVTSVYGPQSYYTLPFDLTHTSRWAAVLRNVRNADPFPGRRANRIQAHQQRPGKTGGTAPPDR